MTDTVDVTTNESEASITAAESGVSVASASLSDTPLIVTSGETVTVPAGETWTRTYSEVRDGGTLIINGELNRTG